MKSAACVCLLVLFGAGCQPSRFLAGLNRPKDPLDRNGFDDDDRWPDDDSRQDDRPQRSRRRSNETRVAALIVDGKKYLEKRKPTRRDIAAARRSFEDAIQIDPRNGTAHHHLAMIADRQERFRDAERHYKAALRYSRRSASLLCNVGYSYYLQKRYKTSEEYLLEAHELNRRHERTLNNLGALYSKVGDTQKARRFFRLTGASRREIDDLIAGLNPAAASQGVRMASGTYRDGGNRRLGAPRPRTSGSDRYKDMSAEEVRRLMAIRGRQGRAERQQRAYPDRSIGGVGGSDPWRGDDRQDRPGMQRSNRGIDQYDDRSLRNPSRNGSTRRSDYGIRRADWDNDNPSANQSRRESSGYRVAPLGDDRNDIGSRDRSQRQDSSGTGTYAPPPSGAGRQNNDRNDNSDRHIFPSNNGDGHRYGSMKSPDSYDRAAQLPAAGSNDTYRGGVSDIDRKAHRTAHNVGFGPMFDLPTRGNDDERNTGRSGSNARPADYQSDGRSGVRSADFERNRGYDRSSDSGNRRPRYTAFRRGSERSAARGDSTGYDDRSNESRDPSVPEIKFYPRNTGVRR